MITKIVSKELARCTVKGFKLVALALRNGFPIAAACNRWSDNGTISEWSEHAEERLVRKLIRINAINRFRGKLSVLVLRFGGVGHGTLRMAKPCGRCQLLLNAAGITEVSYSDVNGNIKEM